MTVFHAIRPARRGDRLPERQLVAVEGRAGSERVTVDASGVPVRRATTTRGFPAGPWSAAHHGLPAARRGSPGSSQGIAVAGGMAGGSADAAATLVALDRLWGLESGRPGALLELAAGLGSYVPFGLVGRNAPGPAAASWSAVPDLADLVVGRRPVEWGGSSTPGLRALRRDVPRRSRGARRTGRGG